MSVKVTTVKINYFEKLCRELNIKRGITKLEVESTR